MSWYNISDSKYMGWVPIQLHLKLNNTVNMRGAYVMLLLLISKTFFAYSTL